MHWFLRQLLLLTWPSMNILLHLFYLLSHLDNDLGLFVLPSLSFFSRLNKVSLCKQELSS